MLGHGIHHAIDGGWRGPGADGGDWYKELLKRGSERGECLAETGRKGSNLCYCSRIEKFMQEAVAIPNT